jgi:hypothetical protein
MRAYLILPPRGSIWRRTDAPISRVCLLVTVLGARKALDAMRRIFGDVIGCGSRDDVLLAID